MELVLTLAEELERKVAASQEQVNHLEDKLAVLYPQLDKLHTLTSSYARGPQQRLLRELNVVRRKVAALEGLLTDARDRLAASQARATAIARKAGSEAN
jgi:hypothetical protein